MRDREWVAFLALTNLNAKSQLTALALHFCARGEGNLPERAFYRISDTGTPNHLNLFAFQAFGIELRGRKAVVAGQKTFFVIELSDDNPSPTAAPQTRRRQLDLPLFTLIK
jgi:hypothetical protein